MKTAGQRFIKRFRRARNNILLKQTLSKKQFTKNKYAIFPDRLAILRTNYQTKKLARKYDGKPVRIFIDK